MGGGGGRAWIHSVYLADYSTSVHTALWKDPSRQRAMMR